MDLKVERESQFNTAGRSEFQVRGAAVLNDRLANDVRRNGTHRQRSSVACAGVQRDVLAQILRR